LNFSYTKKTKVAGFRGKAPVRLKIILENEIQKKPQYNYILYVICYKVKTDII
jgi:hypothetical protein